MSIRTVFYLSFQGLAVQERSAGGWQTLARFSDDESGRAAFRGWLLSQSRRLAVLLIDVPEEDFHVESIPPLHGAERRTLLQRRFDQHFRNSDFRAASSLGREAQGRRDERILFSGLRAPEWLTRWLDILEDERWPLAGVQSPALLTTPLVRRMAPTVRRMALLGFHPSAGLRQTFIDEQGVKLSRLIPVADEDLAALPERMLEESRRALQFLASLRLMSRDEPLAVWIIAPKADWPALAAVCSDQDQLHFHWVTPDDLAGQAGLANAEMLFVEAAVRQRPHNHYAPTERLWYYHLWLAAKMLRWGALVGGLGLVAASLGLWGSTRLLQAETASHERETQRLIAQYQADKTLIDQFRVDAADMSAVVDIYRRLLKPWPELRPALSALAQAFAAEPSLMVDKLAWRVASLPGETPWGSNAAEAPPESVAPETEAAPPEAPCCLVLGIEGHIEPFSGDYRRALAALDRWKAQLEAAHFQLEWQAQPIDLRSSGSIDHMSQGEEARFSARLQWSLGGASHREEAP